MTTQRYKTLQEKLQELEAKLSLVFSLPAGSSRRDLHCECIKQRFGFLKNLLSAEINACRPSKSIHLGRIEKRLAELEIAFRELEYNNWDTAAAAADSAEHVCSCDGEATIDLTSPELGTSSSEDDELIEYSHRNYNQNHGKGGNTDSSRWDGASTSTDYQKINDSNTFRGMKGKDKERRISRSGYNYCGALISGMTFGMVLVGAAIAILGDFSSWYSIPPRDALLFYT